jgi:hypothetical protein
MECVRCGSLLARDNRANTCGPCQRRSNGTVPPVPPEGFWKHPSIGLAAAQGHFGLLVWAIRTHPWHGRTVPQRQVAGWLGITQGEVSRLENRREPPVLPTYRLQHWLSVLHVPPGLRWGAGGTATEGEVGATDRRDLIMTAGTLAAGALTFGVPELLDFGSTLDTGTASADTAAGLLHVSGELGIEFRRDLASVLGPARMGLQEVSSLLSHRQPTTVQRDLVLAGGQFSFLAGNSWFEQRNPLYAEKAFTEAEHAARDVGHPDLVHTVASGRAFGYLYANSPRRVVALLRPMLEAGPTPSAPVALLWGLLARAYAMLGDSGGFRDALGRADDSLAQSRSPVEASVFSCTPAKLNFYRADGAAMLGQKEAVAVADRALAMLDGEGVPDEIDFVLIRLARARALVTAGEAEEAAGEAVRALSGRARYTSVVARAEALEIPKCAGSAQWHEAQRRLALTSHQ